MVHHAYDDTYLFFPLVTMVENIRRKSCLGKNKRKGWLKRRTFGKSENKEEEEDFLKLEEKVVSDVKPTGGGPFPTVNICHGDSEPGKLSTFIQLQSIQLSLSRSRSSFSLFFQCYKMFKNIFIDSIGETTFFSSLFQLTLFSFFFQARHEYKSLGKKPTIQYSLLIMKSFPSQNLSTTKWGKIRGKVKDKTKGEK